MSVRVLVGDAVVRLPELEPASADSVVTDPPYGLEFMSVAWDTFNDGRKGGERVPNTWGDHGSKEHPRNAYQTAHIAAKKNRAFGEFSAAWAVAALRVLKPGGYLVAFGGTRTYHRLTCAIEDSGFQVRDCLMWLYGSGFPKGKGCLKPGWEPIVLARKPAPAPWLNVDGCRIEGGVRPLRSHDESASGLTGTGGASAYGSFAVRGSKAIGDTTAGRWPANVVLDEHAALLLDEQSGERKSGGKVRGHEPSRTGQKGIYGTFGRVENHPHNDSGGASRFFYCAKASPAERRPYNDHPTVKPLALMQWLIRLVTPPGGTVLDPFCGSGSTLIAADREGFSAIGIDSDPHAVEIARRRIEEDAGLFAEVS